MRKRIILFILIVLLIFIFFNQFNKYRNKSSNNDEELPSVFKFVSHDMESEKILFKWMESGKMASIISDEEYTLALKLLYEYHNKFNETQKMKTAFTYYISKLYEKYNKKPSD